MKRWLMLAGTLLAAVTLQGGSHGQPAPTPEGSTGIPNDLTHAATMGPKGSLAIRAVQGTKGGPPVGGEDVEIVLYHRDKPVQQIKSKLDEQGLLVVGDLPVGLGLRPLVRVKHAGVLYQDAGPPMNEHAPQATVEVVVYELTDEPPEWRIKARQLAAAVVPVGIDVAEIVVVENGADRTWMGAPADAAGRRATVRLTLPPEAVEVELLQGFHGWCCSAYDPPALTVQMPLMPGETTFRFAYKIPVRGGSSDLRIRSGAPTDRAAFVVPSVGMEVKAEGASESGTEVFGGVSTRRFSAEGVAADQLVGLVLTNIVHQGSPSAPPPRAEPSGSRSPGSGGAYWLWGGLAAGAASVWIAWTALRRSAGNEPAT